MASTKKMVEVT